MPPISGHAEHGSGCTHGRQELTSDWIGPACPEISGAFGKEVTRGMGGLRGIPRLEVGLFAAVLGVVFLLMSRVASPAAAPEVKLAPDASHAPGPLAWWRLNEGAGGVVHDVTGHGYDGVIHGAPTWGEGPSGRALVFDGSSFVELVVEQASRFEGPITIQALICPTDDKPNTYKHILEFPDGYLLRLDNPPEAPSLSI